MALSTMTLAELKARAENLMDEEGSLIGTETFIYAVNDFLQYYQTEEMVNLPQKWSKTLPAISVDSNGYDLSNIPNLYGTKLGFKVYEGSEAKGNRLFPTGKTSNKRGYYIEDGKLYLNFIGTTAVTIIIKYFEKTTKYTTDVDLNTTTLPIELGAERGAELMVGSRFLEKDQSDPQRAINMRNDARREINDFFMTGRSVSFIAI